MNIEILRIGQRVLRDDRVTTHVALVARAFGASKIYMNEINPDIRDTINQINTTWGGKFEIEFITDWKNVINSKKNTSKIIHLTMYGENINEIQNDIQKEKEVLIVVGAEKYLERHMIRQTITYQLEINHTQKLVHWPYF